VEALNHPQNLYLFHYSFYQNRFHFAFLQYCLDQTIPGTRDDEDDETLDVPVTSPPKADDDDDTRE
jgi:hypothetical protein